MSIPTPPKTHLDAMQVLEAAARKDKEKHLKQRSAQIKHLDDGAIKGHGATARPVQDGWSNVLTGLGTGRDKRMANNALWGLSLAEEEAENLYASDTTARRIVDLLPNEALRERIDWMNEGEGETWDKEIERLQVWPKFHEAWSFARLYGGAGILINDGVTPVDQLDKPLTTIDNIASLVVLSRWELWAYATDLQRDITKPAFGLPTMYRIYPRMTFGQTAIRVHASRIIRFDGRRLPRLLHIRNNFWGDSVLTSLRESLADFKVTGGNIASVLQDFRLLVTKMAGLSDAINAGKEDAVRKRFEIMDLARSVLGSYVLDSEDEMDFHSASLAGVAELADKVKERLQAETDIPHTILWNEGPAGALGGGNAGNSEERMWYNTVHAERMKYLKPRLDQLLKLMGTGTKTKLVVEADGIPSYEFGALWQMDDSAKAEMDYKSAQTDQLYLDMGIRTPANVQMQRFPEEAAEMPAEEGFVKPPEAGAIGPDGKPLPPKEGAPPPQAGGSTPPPKAEEKSTDPKLEVKP